MLTDGVGELPYAAVARVQPPNVLGLARLPGWQYLRQLLSSRLAPLVTITQAVTSYPIEALTESTEGCRRSFLVLHICASLRVQ